MTASAAGRILLCLGDPNGIGPEIAVKAARSLAGTAAAPVLVGDRHVVRAVADARTTVRDFVPSASPDADAIDLVDVVGLASQDWRPGAMTAAGGAATVQYVQAALDVVRRGEAAAIVAGPHSETAVNASGIPFCGYPSLLRRLLDISDDDLFVMLVFEQLRIVHTTLHERLADALARLTPELVVKAATAAAAALATLNLTTPRIGIFGINPHAGENGLFGDDDERIVVPAVSELRDRGLSVDGPIGADVLVRSRGYDAFVAMYHDQGHVPVKLLGGISSSALTVGAGVLFASVGHGAAFDIAGQGVADSFAVISTIRLLASTTTPADDQAVR